MHPHDLEDELQVHDLRVQKHGVEWAENRLRDKQPEVAEAIIDAYRERIGELVQPPCGLIDPDNELWYMPKPEHESPRWKHARGNLGLSAEVLDRTSEVADQILARLGNPKAESITTRGLVLGYVQSGKTTSFLSVAAKATDNGYDLVIILAGVHNSLRRQTQDRAVRTLVHKSDLWWLGTATGDFTNDGNSLGSHLAGNGKRGLLVVKKHPIILERLADWLEEERDQELRRRAILVIDDEADQAGLDVSTGGELKGIHKQLRRIVDLRTADGERRAAYLAYTATPYANILTSQDEFGLYPRDFIYPLEKPSGYVGSQELFGDQQVGKPIQIENDDHIGEDLTAGLRDAITWFVLATAARVGLGTPLESFHSSMLIHTTQLRHSQLAYRPLVEEFLRGLRDDLDTDESKFEQFYETKLQQVPTRPGGGEGFLDERTAAWHEVRPHISAVIDRLLDRTPAGPAFKEDGRIQQAHSGVIVDNSMVDWKDRLTYSDIDAGQPSVTVIAIGGNTLSRGLTLEGLVCSYFARTARTYDSLMQMGRWYGYRPGYQHLLRVWTTKELFNWFRELDQVEQELRDELLWMQDAGLSPREYGPRIRVSPNLNITRAAAMRSVSNHISYSDTLIDPAWLNLDEEALEANETNVRTFAAGLDPWVDKSEPRTFRGVPIGMVRDLLDKFRFHPEEKRVDVPSLQRYLSTEKTALAGWNVVFKSIASSRPPYAFGEVVGAVTPVVRSQLSGPTEGYIGSLVDSSDHRADLGGSNPEHAKYRAKGEPPLLTIYVIDPTSNPVRNTNRVALNATRHPIGLSIALPESNTNVDYVAPAIASIDPRLAGADLEDIHG